MNWSDYTKMLADDERDIPEFLSYNLWQEEMTILPKKVFTREEIFDRVWGSNIVVGDRTIDLHIRKLREKLGSEYIHTVKRIGYKYVAS